MTHPIKGGVYWVETYVFPTGDKKPRRPVVVISDVIFGTDEVHVWPRTSKSNRPGIDHPKNLALKLTVDGRFCERDVTRIATRWFDNPKVVTFAGMLQQEYMDKLMDRWDR